MRKTFFYIHTNIVTKKWGGINARNNFSRNTLIVREKNGEKIVGKSKKNVFLHSHKYRYQKIGGKKARNNFSRNSRIVRSKNVRKKSSEISAKNVFYIYTNIVTKKGGEKRAKQFFQKHTNIASKKCWGKIVGKK